MTKKSFTKPPLSEQAKEAKAEEFINMLPMSLTRTQDEEGQERKRVTKKDAFVPYPLRVPQGLYDDLKEISYITGLSFNSICIEILRVSAKQKLKELKEL